MYAVFSPIVHSASSNVLISVSLERESLSTTMKTLWFNEGNNYELIAVDARIQGGNYVKVALYRSNANASLMPTVSVKERSSHDKRAAADHADHNVAYYVDIISNDKEKMHLQVRKIMLFCIQNFAGRLHISSHLFSLDVSQVVLPNEKPLADITLQCVKIYGDMLLLGGSDGKIAIGIVGRTTDMSAERNKKVLYCILCKPSIGSMQDLLTAAEDSSAPAPPVAHSDDATIKFVAWEDQSNIFVAADDLRVLSIWYLAKQDHMLMESPSKKKTGFYYGIKPEFQSTFDLARTDPSGLYELERILAVYFLTENGNLIVSTSQRLLLLLVTYECRPSENETSECHFAVSGYVELDHAEPSQRGLFGLQIIDPPTLNVSNTSRSPKSSNNLERRLSYRQSEYQERKIVVWRLTSSDNYRGNAEEGNSNEELNLCQVFRTEWSKEKYAEVVRNIIPVA